MSIISAAARGPKRKAIAAALALLCLGVFFGREYLRYPPYRSQRALEAPSGAFPGKNGGLYIIDGGKKTVLAVGADGVLERELRAGDDAFYYASLVCEGDDGSVYVSDALYSGQGTLIAAERVFRYEGSSSRAEMIYEIAYPDYAEAPRQYGRIADMRERDGVLTLAVKTSLGAEIRDIDLSSGESSAKTYNLNGAALSDLSFDPETKLPVFTTRTGEVSIVGQDGGIRALVGRGFDILPWTVSAEGGYAYYCDIETSSVARVSVDGGEPETVASVPGMLSFARVRNGIICASDGEGVYMCEIGGTPEYIGAVRLAPAALRALVWAAAAGAVASALILASAFLPALVRKKRGELFRRAAVTLTAAAAVCALSSYIAISRMTAERREETMRQLRLFGDIMAERADAELLRAVDGAEDYGGAEYRALKEKLDGLTEMTYDNGMCYYYGIYVTDGSVIYGVMDYEDTITARHPFFEYGAEGYTDAFEGETLEVASEVSSYGAWAFVIRPIFDAEGAVVGVLEVGADLDELNARSRETVRELVLTVASAAAVLVILMIEAILLSGHYERGGREGGGRRASGLPLRAIVFTAYAADCVQDSFAAIYSARLYTPVFGIPREIGAALPLSAQLLAAAASAIVCGRAVRRLGARRAMLFGFTVQIAGFILCASVESYAALVVGKALIGCGLGFITVSANSEAAAGESESAREELFASISAGVLAGVTVGAGIGSVALSFWSFGGVFAVGAALAVLGAALIVGTKTERYVPAARLLEQTPKRREAGRGALGFLTRREVFSFLLFLLTPFMIMLSFREYFFPLYAAEAGVGEAYIGRVYLLCGVASIYLGPRLTIALISRLGERRTVVLASALASASAIIFAIAPSVASAIAGVALLSTAASFGYAAQSAYYAGLGAATEYGEGRAMGVYSIFDNAGQTIGPMLYAAAMLAGSRAAAGMIGAGLGGLAVIFAILNRRKER